MAEVILRTREELALADYNYYIFFRIPPTEKDVAKIEMAIKQEKNKWTQGLPHQRRYKELYTDVENVMLKDMSYDPATQSYSKPGARAAELAAAKKLKLKAAEDVIVTICQNKGRLYKSDLQKVANADKIQWFTQAELEKAVEYLTKQGVRYVDDTQTVIDFRKYKEVEKLLVTAKKKSLYEVLGKTDKDSAKTLVDACQAASAAIKNKTSPEGLALDRLTGIAKVLFKTEDSKTQYDQYLAIKESVWDEMEKRQSFGIKEISMSEFLDYAERIRATLKLDIDKVELYLAAGLKEYKIIVGGSEDAGMDLEICPYPECGRAYQVQKGRPTTSCPHCGKPLEVVCWNCGGKMPFTSKQKTCPTCRSTQQGKTMFDARMADIEKLLRQPVPSIPDLQTALSNLVNAAPNYKSAPKGYAATKIGEYEKVINDKIQEERTTGAKYRGDIQKVQNLMNGKMYQQAQNAAMKLRTTYGTYNAANTNGLIADIDKVLAQAQAQVRNAKTYEAQRNVDMVISSAAKALDICADYNEARMILQKYPPEAPKAIRMSLVNGNAVRIDWDKSASQLMTTYTIIKQVGSKPIKPEDGTELDSKLTINFYEDQNIAAATPYYYAVYAERCGVRSNLVSTPSPAVVLLDVANLQQQLVQDKIQVTWDCPHNVKAVEVWKKEGPVAPSGVGDGVQVKTDGLKGFTDTQCAYENSYLIHCVYEIGGKKQYSRGLRRTMKKFESLQKIENPKMDQQITGEFVFTCDSQPNQKIKMIYAKEKIACRTDEIMQMINYNSICKGCGTIAHHYDNNQNIAFSLPEGQVCWVYPMVYNEQLFMLSKPYLLNNINGLRNLTYTETQGTVMIRGTISNETKNLIVKISGTDFPKTVDDPGEKFVITKEQFVRDGGISVKLKTNTINYISVFVELEKDGVRTVTKPTRVGDQPIDYREKVMVRYALNYKVSPRGNFPVTVEFAADSPVELPKLCLVKGSPRPMSKNAGELVNTIEPAKLQKGLFSKSYTAKVKIMANSCPVNTKFAVFMYDESVKYVMLKEVNSI